VIDATGAPPRQAVSILIEAGRIARIAPALEPPSGATVIDAAGKFVIPGLWDMHGHLDPPERTARRMVGWGVTGVRDMYSGFAPAAIARWRTQPDVPRVAISGFLDGPLMLTGGPAPPGAAAVANAEEARTAVQVLASQGIEAIKVYNSLSRDTYFAIAEEARRIGMPFIGHVPEAVSPAEAAQAGQLSQEHLLNVLLACSTREEELRAERVALLTDPGVSPAERARLLGFPKPEGLFETYSQEKAAKLFETFVDYGVWQTPTLVLLKHFAEDTDAVRKLPFMQDLDAQQIAAFQARVRALLERHQRLVGDMHRAGVKFLAGTDANASTPVPTGLGIHQELELLVESGFTPLEALQTATYNAGFYFGILSLMGTVEEGKIADLLLLDADPLADIRNTRQIHAVIMRGVYFGRETLTAWRETPN
jgi:imidazolonepropionase-like amidohydrolase